MCQNCHRSLGQVRRDYLERRLTTCGFKELSFTGPRYSSKQMKSETTVSDMHCDGFAMATATKVCSRSGAATRPPWPGSSPTPPSTSWPLSSTKPVWGWGAQMPQDISGSLQAVWQGQLDNWSPTHWTGPELSWLSHPALSTRTSTLSFARSTMRRGCWHFTGV